MFGNFVCLRDTIEWTYGNISPVLPKTRNYALDSFVSAVVLAGNVMVSPDKSPTRGPTYWQRYSGVMTHQREYDIFPQSRH